MKTRLEKIVDYGLAFHREEDGPTAVEYAVMLALIIVVCIGSVKVLASKTGESYDNSSDAINAVM